MASASQNEPNTTVDAFVSTPGACSIAAPAAGPSSADAATEALPLHDSQLAAVASAVARTVLTTLRAESGTCSDPLRPPTNAASTTPNGIPSSPSEPAPAASRAAEGADANSGTAAASADRAGQDAMETWEGWYNGQWAVWEEYATGRWRLRDAPDPWAGVPAYRPRRLRQRRRRLKRGISIRLE